MGDPPPFRSRMSTRPSVLPAATRVPSGLNATPAMRAGSARRTTRRSLPVAVQTRTVPSEPPAATRVPSKLKATLETSRCESAPVGHRSRPPDPASANPDPTGFAGDDPGARGVKGDAAHQRGPQDHPEAGRDGIGLAPKHHGPSRSPRVSDTHRAVGGPAGDSPIIEEAKAHDGGPVTRQDCRGSAVPQAPHPDRAVGATGGDTAAVSTDGDGVDLGRRPGTGQRRGVASCAHVPDPDLCARPPLATCRPSGAKATLRPFRSERAERPGGRGRASPVAEPAAPRPWALRRRPAPPAAGSARGQPPAGHPPAPPAGGTRRYRAGAGPGCAERGRTR